MNSLEKEILNSIKDNNFLNIVSGNSLGENKDKLQRVLVTLQNERRIDIVSEFKKLKNDKNHPHFFSTRRVFEKILPEIDSPIQPVIECILHIVNEAGEDLLAGTPLEAYIEFCGKKPERPKKALELIKNNPSNLLNILSPTLISGSKTDIEYHADQAIQLAQHDDIEFRRRSLFAIGKIEFKDNNDLSEKAFQQLEKSANEELDDQLLGTIIKSIVIFCKYNQVSINRITKIIETASEKGNDHALHAISENFGFNNEHLNDDLVDIYLSQLKKVNPKNTRTIDNIDFGLAKVLSNEKPEKGVQFLEAILIANRDSLSIKSFDSVVSELYKNKNELFCRIMTRWFIKGDRTLCNAVREVVQYRYRPEKKMQMEAISEELPSKKMVHIVFLARKAIGFLFNAPATAISIVISLFAFVEEEETKKELTKLIFDPLMINYPGYINEYIDNNYNGLIDEAQSACDTAKAEFDQYIENLKSTGKIPELHPPQTHKDTYRRHFTKEMTDAMNEAEKESVLLSLVSKSVLLYGRTSISYVYDPNDKPHRNEMQLHKHGTEIEFPRVQNIDPFGLDYMLRVFRSEKFK
jgi:hypothetical protein